jgi:hypothetical protein
LPQEKSIYLIATLKGRAADVLYGIPKNATYEETLQALQDRFGDQHFAALFRSRLKTRIQRAGESLQDFAITVEQLAHRAYPTLPDEHKRQEAGRAFVDGIEYPDIKIKLLLGGEKTVNEALRQALELQAMLLVARPHKSSTMTIWGRRSPPTRRRDARKSECWSCGEPGHFKSTCPYKRKANNDQRREHENRPSRARQENPRRSERWPSNNKEPKMRGWPIVGKAAKAG